MAISPLQLDRAWAALSEGRFGEVVTLTTELLNRGADNPSVLACEALARWRRGEPSEVSIEMLERAVKLSPKDAQLRHHLATVLASAGRIADAQHEFEVSLQIDPRNVETFFAYSQHFKVSADLRVLSIMCGLIESNALPPIERELCAFGLAKAFDDLGDPERAFSYAEQANAMVNRPFNFARQRAELEDLRALVAADVCRSTADSESEATPIFVVGMSRSGTTLVDAILSRHPDVLSQGETLDFIELQQAAMARSGASSKERAPMDLVSALSRSWLQAAAAAVLKKTGERAHGRHYKVSTDKLPDNATRLGLIAKVFPRAKVIYVRRHPLDVGWSNYIRRFTTGQAFSFGLDTIGQKSRIVAETMSLWKRGLDLRFLDVTYEALVGDPEEQIRRIVEFAELDWSDACLRPDLSSSSVLTASMWQVRQPITQGSIGRWRPYESKLAPMIEAMGGWDWINAELADQARVAMRSTSKS